MKDGRLLEGRIASTSGVADHPDLPTGQAGGVRTKLILIVDDSLRRTFVSKFQVAEIVDAATDPLVKITVWQNADLSGRAIASVGPSLGVTPFDEFGRRVYRMRAPDGPLDVVQGITELTPLYAKVEGLQGAPNSVVWDMRIATSSIPPDMLDRILDKAVPRDDPQARLQVVRFYLQAERYHDARRELQRIIEEYPEMQELEAQYRQLRQMGARRVMQEIELRKSAGQHQLILTLLENFPSEEVAGETLQHVREWIAEYENLSKRVTFIRERLDATVAQIDDESNRKIVEPIAKEIIAGLSYNNVQRLTPFAQLLDDESMSPDQKSALAISGWLLGANDATDKLATAVSMVRVRTAVRSYLREPQPLQTGPIARSDA